MLGWKKKKKKTLFLCNFSFKQFCQMWDTALDSVYLIMKLQITQRQVRDVKVSIQRS